jgi:hypothetical protein
VWGGCAWLIDGFWIGWLDLSTPYSHNSGLQAIQRYHLSIHITVHRYIRTRVLSLQYSYPGNGFITVFHFKSHTVFFSQPNSFLAIMLQLPTQFNSSAPKLTPWQADVSKFDSIPLNWTLLYNDFARTTQKIHPLYCWEAVFAAPLHSNGSYSIVACAFVAAGMCLPSRCLAMNVCSDFTIPAFGRHVTIHF